jgi:hypothetical protein
MGGPSDQETNDPLIADQRNYYEVEKCGIIAQLPHLAFGP